MSESPDNAAGPGRPLAVIEAELMQDAETKKVAEALGIPLEEYVALVMDYVKNPDKEPEVDVYDEESMAAFEGERPMTIDEMNEWLKKVESGEIHFGPHEFMSDFDDEEETATESKAMKMTGKKRQTSAPKAGEAQSKVLTEDNDAGKALRDQLMAQAQAARTHRRGPKEQ